MKRHPKQLLLIGLAGLMLLPATEAFAERKSPLEGQPAVRNRLLLVKNRFEVTTAFEASLNADFRHTAAGGLKLEYHLGDMVSLGGLFFYGRSFNTGLTDRILRTLPLEGTPGEPTPSRREFREHLNSMPLHGAVYASVTPWYGKLAAFGKFFVNFDFYFQGGLAFAQLKNECCTFPVDPNPQGDFTANPPVFPDNNPNNDDPLNDGNRFGIYLGGGIHVFLNNWIALDLTVRDYWFNDNPSGLDYNADLAVTDDDQRFLHHLFMGVGISFFFPTTPQRTR
jgi:outer membrane beta-barrel protein